MGAASSLISGYRREAVRIAVHEALTINLYPLEERRFSKGSFYDNEQPFAVHRPHISVFQTLGLHEWSVSQLWRHFRQMNKTGSGAVSLWEFREYFDLPDDRSTTRLFRCFDEDRDNRIGFVEFVVGLWTYCCNCHAALMCFSFDLYDTDHNGSISLEEADFMIEDVFGLEWESNDLGRAVHAWVHGREDAVLGSPELSVDDWSAFMSLNHLAVAKAVRTRLVLQTKVLGVGFWTHCLSKNMTIYVGRQVGVEQVLGAHVSEDVLEILANDRNPTSDHNDATQLTLKVLRRTGPFPRRRKYRDMKGKKLAMKADAKLQLLSVRQTFESLTVPPGEDASWEEPKAPSALQALMSTLPALQERCPAHRGHAGRGGAAVANDPETERDRMRETISKQNKKLSTRAKIKSPLEALALLEARPGLNGSPLGSPSSRAGAVESVGLVAGVDDDPVIANAFYGLKILPDGSQSERSVRGSTRGRRRSKKSLKRGSSYRDGLPSPSGERNTGVSPSMGGSGRRPACAPAGGGKMALSRAGRELVITGELQGVGSSGEGDGARGEGALSMRLC